MANELIINVNPFESRAALLENGNVAELHIERETDTSLIGNIYKGRVIKILPGMEAAFVDVGLERSAFLYVGDVAEQSDELFPLWSKDDNGDSGPLAPGPGYGSPVPIEDLLQEGQEIMVQVAKPPLGGKGARLTSHITLPGRHLVLMPSVNHIGISRRITDEAERQRLKELLLALKPPDCGLIARTASEGCEPEKLQSELDFLLRLWKSLCRKRDQVGAPFLLHRELDTTLRVVRDLFTKEIDRLIVDDPETYDKICNFVESFQPHLHYNVELYGGTEPIFDYYGIELELMRALGKKVWLKSGGYIIIEHTEALVTIDINTGRYVGKHNLEETILKTNLEAVKEIAYQLRLRNIGGLIVIDFIDMIREANRDKVFNALKDALRKDRAKTTVLKMSELGLIEMTRQRSRESLHHLLTEPCPYCEQRGFVRSRLTIVYNILRELMQELREIPGDHLTLGVHPEVADVLVDTSNNYLVKLGQQYHKKISLRSNAAFHLEQYEISM